MYISVELLNQLRSINDNAYFKTLLSAIGDLLTDVGPLGYCGEIIIFMTINDTTDMAGVRKVFNFAASPNNVWKFTK